MGEYAARAEALVAENAELEKAVAELKEENKAEQERCAAAHI